MAGSSFLPYHSQVAYKNLAKTFATLRSSLSLVLLGNSGVGKSSLGNQLLGKDKAFGAYGVIRESGVLLGHELTVTDTPSAGSLSQEMLESAVPPDAGVSAFLLILRLDKPYSNTDEQSVKHLKRMFGSRFKSFAVLVFSHADCVGNDKTKFEQKLEQQKKDSEQFALLMKKMDKNGYFMVDATKKSSVEGAAPRIMSAVEKIIGWSTTSSNDKLALYTRGDLLDALLKKQRDENSSRERRRSQNEKKQEILKKSLH